MSIIARASVTLTLERDIASVWRFYNLSASTTTPAAWTSSEIADYIAYGNIVAGWKLTEPTYDGTATNSLYAFFLTVFTDGTYNVTSISKSTSYEAAKLAYNLANAASNAAGKNEEKIAALLGEMYIVDWDGDVVEVETDTFAAKMGNALGDYEFLYDGSSWSLSDKSVQLSEYGISLVDGYTPVSGSTFTINYTSAADIANGNYSTLEELLEVLQNYNGQLVGLIESLEAANEELVSSQVTIEALRTQVELLERSFTDEQTGRYARMQFGFDDNTNPVLTLSGGENADLKVAISNSQMQFIDHDTVVAYVNGEKLYIQTAQVTEQLRFGNFAFIPRVNGNMSLKYIGE